MCQLWALHVVIRRQFFYMYTSKTSVNLEYLVLVTSYEQNRRGSLFIGPRYSLRP